MNTKYPVTDEQKKQIEEMVKNGYTYKEISEITGIHWRGIQRVGLPYRRELNMKQEKRIPSWFQEFKAEWNEIRRAAGKEVKTMNRECCTCDCLETITNSRGETVYLCVNTDSPAYLSETGICGGCDYEDNSVQEE